MKRFTIFSAAALLILCAASARAETKVETILTGLDNPCGVAVQPGTGHVFVSDSAAGRIIRIIDGKAEDVIVDFPLGEYGKGPFYKIGPLGLAFLDENTLVVGGGGLPDGEELLRTYKTPKAGAAAIKASQMASSSLLPPDGDTKGEGNFYAVASNGKAVFVTSNGDDTKGWVARASIVDGKVKKIKRFIATKEATEVDAPVGIAIAKRGAIFVGQMGEINKPQDALLTIYNAKKGKMVANFEVGLFDITALAFSPKTNKLYALDFAWMASEEAGLYRLGVQRKKNRVNTKKIAKIGKPTAMAFDAEGALYITVGTDKDAPAKSGKLLKIAPGL